MTGKYHSEFCRRKHMEANKLDPWCFPGGVNQMAHPIHLDFVKGMTKLRQGSDRSMHPNTV